MSSFDKADWLGCMQGNRRYIKCLYVYNKIDVCSIEEVDAIARYWLCQSCSATEPMRMPLKLLLFWHLVPSSLDLWMLFSNALAIEGHSIVRPGKVLHHSCSCEQSWCMVASMH